MIEKLVQVKTRMPTHLAEWLREQAANNHRTQTAEIVHLIERAKREQSGA